MKRVFEKIIGALAVAALAFPALAVKINAPGDINNFAPAVVTVMGVNNAGTATKWAAPITLSLTGSVTGSASIDGSGNVSISTTIPGGTGCPSCLLIANNLSDVASAATSRTNLAVPGLTTANSMTGLNTFNGTALNISDANATSKNLHIQTAGSNRWDIYSSSISETGSNAGSDFAIGGYSDTGSYLGDYFKITRATGASTIAGAFTVGGVTTLSGAVTVNGVATFNAGGGNYPVINGAAGTQRNLAGATAGTYRWLLTLGNNGSESGSNAGSDFALSGCTDAGSCSASFLITRATNAATFNGTLTSTSGSAGTDIIASGQNSTLRRFIMQTNGVNRWTFYANNDTESGSNTGSSFGINALSDAGVFLSTPISIVRATGITTINNGLTIASAASFTAGNTGSNFVIGGVTSGSRSVTFNNFGQPTYRYDDNSAAATLGTLTNYAISASGQGSSFATFNLGTGGVLGGRAAQINILTTDNWSAAGNRSAKWQMNLLYQNGNVVAEEIDPGVGQNLFGVTVIPRVPIAMGVATFTNTAAFSPTIAQLAKTNLITAVQTANITVTLPACIPGQDIRWTRTAASTGAFTTTIAGTNSKGLAAATWADFSCSGTGFVETASGSL